MSMLAFLFIAFVAKAAIIQIPNCIDATGDGICQECVEGYWVVRGWCEPADPTC